MQVQPILGAIEFGARVVGVQLVQADEDTFTRLVHAAHRYAVLVIPDQHDLDDATQIAFSQRLGPLERAFEGDSVRMGCPPEITHIGNVDAFGNRHDASSDKVIYDRGNQSWHTDSSFKPVPAKFSILSARTVPDRGGETEFADSRAAYDTWPGLDHIGKEDLLEAICGHSIVYSRMQNTGDIFTEEEKRERPTVRQRLIRRHPETGRRNFYAGSHAAYIEGWDPDRGRALLDHVNDWIARPERIYHHAWRTGDVVIWDNRRVLHRGRPWPETDEVRVMHRTTVAGDGPSTEERV